MNKNHPLKKVLITADNLGGVWTYCIELLSELDKNNISTALAVMGAPLSADQTKQLNHLKNFSLYEGNYKLEWMEDPWEDVDEAGEWLLNIRDEFHPDVVHLNSFSFGALNWTVPVVTVAHSDVISWWRSVLNHPHPKRLNEYYQRVKNGLHNSQFVIAASKAMLKHLNDIYGQFPNQKVIYNGRSPEFFHPGIKQNVVFSMGRIWDSGKNISLLVNAAPMLKWKVRIAGNTQNPVTYEQTAQGNLEFLGTLSHQEISSYLSTTSIFVHPAKYEPFGLSSVEAALSGCALVLGAIDSLYEIWEDSAVYVNTDSIEDLASKVNMLIEDDSLREEYSRRAMKRAAEYSTSRMIAGYLEVYESILKNHVTYSKDIHY